MEAIPQADRRRGPAPRPRPADRRQGGRLRGRGADSTPLWTRRGPSSRRSSCPARTVRAARADGGRAPPIPARPSAAADAAPSSSACWRCSAPPSRPAPQHTPGRAPMPALGPLRTVVVAERPLERGSRLDAPAVAKRLGSREIPARFAPPDALADPASAAGSRTAVPVPAGSYLTGRVAGASLFP